MRNASKLILGMICLVVALFSVCMFMVGGKKDPLGTEITSEISSSSLASAPSEPNSQANTKSTPYIVKGDKRGICVYQEGEPEPITIVEMDISTLPLVDQNLLTSGIRISSKQDLDRLLEDFCS